MFHEVVRTARVWQAGGGCTLNFSPSRTDNMHANATLALMRRHPEKFQTITSDNGTEFHGYAQIEAASPVKLYFATRITAGNEGPTRTPAFASPSALREWVHQSRNAG